jgi:hypothetical protein
MLGFTLVWAVIHSIAFTSKINFFVIFFAIRTYFLFTWLEKIAIIY